MRKSRPSIHLVSSYFIFLLSSFTIFFLPLLFTIPRFSPFLFFFFILLSVQIPLRQRDTPVTIRSRFNPAHALSFVSFHSCPFFSSRASTEFFHAYLSIHLSARHWILLVSSSRHPRRRNAREKREGEQPPTRGCILTQPTSRTNVLKDCLLKSF